jgi:hypothetical protein
MNLGLHPMLWRLLAELGIAAYACTYEAQIGQTIQI